MSRVYSRYSLKAVALLGKLINLHRKEQKFTTQDLADRAGISRTTLAKIEKGDMKCEIGLVFELASLVGLKLFEADLSGLEAMDAITPEKLALLPKSIHPSKKQVDDDF